MSGKGQVLYSPPTSQVYQWVTNPKERSWWNIGCPCKPTAQEDKERWPGPPPPHCLTRASGGRDVGQKGARQTEWGGPGRESGGSVLPLTLLQAAASFGRVPSSCFVLLLPRVRASPAQMAKTLLIQKQGIRELVRSVPFLTPPGGDGEGVVRATLDSLLGKDLLSLQQSTGGCELS